MQLQRGTPGLVSVVIPVYNGAGHLAETLAAVRAQSHPAVEIIVVDDGSTDDSLDVVLRAAPQAQILRQPNAGVSAARNRGLAAARGEYICFLDQDDIWHPLQLERQLAQLAARADTGAAVCRYHHWTPTLGRHEAPADLWPPDAGTGVDPAYSGWVYHQFLTDCWALTSGTLLRTDLVQRAGGFDTTLAYSEEWDLWLRLSRQTCFVLLDWPPVLYRHHAVQGSRRLRRHDFRTELLLRHAAAGGLASADGRALTRAAFDAVIARYRREFGYHHLQYGHRWTGVRSLWLAWWRQPRAPKPLLMALAGALGWRPRPSDAEPRPYEPPRAQV
jgi:glycosyltransferase involved in cell wall biosynthesis